MKKIVYSLVLCAVSATAAFSQTAKDGIRQVEIEKYEKAKNTFKELFQKEATAENAWYAGDVYFIVGNSDSANYYFSQGVTKDPGFALNHVGLGKLNYTKNNEEGKADFEKAKELGKKDARVFMEIAEFLISYDKVEVPSAMALLDVAAKLDSKNPDVNILRGDAFWKVADGSKALAKYEEALKQKPNYAKALMKLGDSYQRVSNYDRAIEMYSKALASDAEYAPAYREMADAYYKKKDMPKAFENYKKYVGLADQDENTTIRYSSFLVLLNKPKEALTVLKPYENREDANPSIYRLLGYSYYLSGDNDKGIMYLEKLWSKAKQEERIAGDYEYYGKMLQKKGQDSLAALNFENAIKMDTSKYDVMSDLASIYMKQKKYSKAAELLQVKVDKKQGTAQDAFNLGRAYYMDKDFVKADSAFGIVVQVVPDYEDGYYWKARSKGNLDPDSKQGLAKPWYEKYIQLASGNVTENKKNLITAYEYLGYYYVLNKDKSKATEAYNKINEIDPGNKKAQDGLKYVNSLK